MIGEAALLAVDVPLPERIRLRRVTSESDVRALSVMHEEIFGGRSAEEMADALLRRLGFRDGMELWVAAAEGEIVSAGRLEPVPATEFAGVWGGATRPEWRGRGIYRALTAAPCTISACAWQEVDPQRLNRKLAPDPRTIGTSEGLDDDALPVGRRQVGARGTPAASNAPAFANDARARLDVSRFAQPAR